MPGGRSRPFRLGDRSELLIQHLLTAVAFTTPVPRQEDIGIDFMCSLIAGYDQSARLLKAGPFFSVQAKSSARAVVFEKPHELEWIRSQENPLLLCVANRRTGAMDVYSTWNLLCGVLNGWKGQKEPSCIRLCPGKRSSEWHGVEDRPDGSQDILLGKPIVRIVHDQIFDEGSTKNLTQVMAEWIALDRENIVNRHGGLNWVVGPLNYETGRPLGPERGVILYSHPQNLPKCAANLGRCATALWKVLNHRDMPKEFVMKAPWDAGMPPLRDLLRWLHRIDPQLRGFAPEVDGL